MVGRARILNGMKEISAFVGFSDATVLKHKRQYPRMPIQLVGGRWVGDPDALEEFYKDLASGNTEKWVEEPPVGQGAVKPKKPK